VSTVVATPYTKGREAYALGHGLDFNPYTIGTFAWVYWQTGWFDAQAVEQTDV
jgi:hypothetical protein